MARQYAEVVKDIAFGQSYDELTAALAEVTAAVLETRKVGEITYKMKIKPNGEATVKIVDEIKVKVPEPTRPESIFYATAEGSLLRENPNQGKLDLRDVNAPRGEVKEA